MGKGISDCHFWYIYPIKMTGLPYFWLLHI